MLTKVLMIILILISVILPSKHILHMFQQNRYEVFRYFKWWKSNTKLFVKEHIVDVILIVISCLSLLVPIILPIVLVAKIGYDISAERKKDYIKPLVVTNRVKRQMVVMAILNISFISVSIYLLPDFLWFLVFAKACFLNDVLICVAAIMLNPIEKKFHSNFKKQAQKILLNQTSLIKVGITGSYGKTSSKNILQQILSNDYYSLMTPASFNTPMGITITIKDHLKPIHEVFICEMGADHVGDIVELMELVKPKIGVVTSIGPQHLTTFKSIDNIINEKMQIIEMLPHGGTGIINLDNKYISEYHVQNKVKLISIGIDNDSADYQAINIKYSNKGSTFDVLYDNETHKFETKLLGKHNIANILVAIAIGGELNIEWDQLVKSVYNCPYIEHRLELKTINGYTFIDNAFNSNPSGAKVSLEVLSMMDNNRFIITPGLIDLGNQQEILNYEFGQEMLARVDCCILVGRHQTRSIYCGLKDSGFNMSNVYVLDTVKEAFALVYQLATSMDTILLENDLPDAFNV